MFLCRNKEKKKHPGGNIACLLSILGAINNWRWCGVVTVFGGPKDGGEVVIALVVVASSTVLLLVPMTMFSVSTGVLS